MVSFPAALVMGVIGIVHDRKKTLAIVVTVISGCAVALYLLMLGLVLLCW